MGIFTSIYSECIINDHIFKNNSKVWADLVVTLKCILPTIVCAIIQ